MPPVQDECRSCSRLGGDFVGKTYSKKRWVRLWFLDRRRQESKKLNLAYLFRKFPNLRTRRRVAPTTDEDTTHFRNVDSSLTSQKLQRDRKRCGNEMSPLFYNYQRSDHSQTGTGKVR